MQLRFPGIRAPAAVRRVHKPSRPPAVGNHLRGKRAATPVHPVPCRASTCRCHPRALPEPEGRHGAPDTPACYVQLQPGPGAENNGALSGAGCARHNPRTGAQLHVHLQVPDRSPARAENPGPRPPASRSLVRGASTSRRSGTVCPAKAGSATALGDPGPEIALGLKHRHQCEAGQPEHNSMARPLP